jgi:ribosomal protein L37E
MAVQTYAVYTRCNQCGVYDREAGWCALCGRPKDGRGAPASEPARTDNLSPRARKRSGGRLTAAATACSAR